VAESWKYVERVTMWIADRNTVQVSFALLASDWEPIAIVTEHVGPFDEVEEIIAEARSEALRLARGELAGQRALPLG